MDDLPALRTEWEREWARPSQALAAFAAQSRGPLSASLPAPAPAPASASAALASAAAAAALAAGAPAPRVSQLDALALDAQLAALVGDALARALAPVLPGLSAAQPEVGALGAALVWAATTLARGNSYGAELQNICPAAPLGLGRRLAAGLVAVAAPWALARAAALGGPLGRWAARLEGAGRVAAALNAGVFLLRGAYASLALRALGQRMRVADPALRRRLLHGPMRAQLLWEALTGLALAAAPLAASAPLRRALARAAAPLLRLLRAAPKRSPAEAPAEDEAAGALRCCVCGAAPAQTPHRAEACGRHAGCYHCLWALREADGDAFACPACQRPSPRGIVDEHLATLRAVRLWIEEVLSIRLGEDLLGALRTGVVLCYLAREVDGACIPQVHGETSTPFRLRENIMFFLAAMEELPRVVDCLAAFAREAQRRGYAGPLMRDPAQLVDPALRLAMPRAQLDALRASIALCRPKAPICRGRVRVSEAVVRRQLALYAGGENKIALDRIEKGFARFQAVWHGYKQRKAYKKIVRDVAYRKRVVREILETEESYIANLEMCMQLFLRPMAELAKDPKASAGGIFTKENVYTIFSDIEVLATLGHELLRELRPISEKWSHNTCLAKTFKNMVGFLPLYTNYVTNYDKALTLVTQLKKKEKFTAWLQACVDNPLNTKRLDLEAYLIQPVQRVPRYLLLLSDLSKHTWPEHPDSELLRDTIARMQSAALLLNEKKRQAENLVFVVQVDGNLGSKPKDFQLIQPSRRLVKEGSLRKHGKSTEIRLFLFNDLILVTKAEGPLRYKYLFSHSSAQCQLAPSNAGPQQLDVIKYGEKKPIMILDCETAAARDVWVKIFETSVHDEKEARKKLSMMQEKILGNSLSSAMPVPASPSVAAAPASAASASTSSAVSSPSSPLVSSVPPKTPDELLLEREREKKRMAQAAAAGGAGLGSVSPAPVCTPARARTLSEDARRTAELARLTEQRDLLETQLKSTKTILLSDKKKKDKETVARAKSIAASLAEELAAIDKQLALLRAGPAPAPDTAASPSIAISSSSSPPSPLSACATPPDDLRGSNGSATASPAAAAAQGQHQAAASLSAPQPVRRPSFGNSTPPSRLAVVDCDQVIAARRSKSTHAVAGGTASAGASQYCTLRRPAQRLSSGTASAGPPSPVVAPQLPPAPAHPGSAPPSPPTGAAAAAPPARSPPPQGLRHSTGSTPQSPAAGAALAQSPQQQGVRRQLPQPPHVTPLALGSPAAAKR
eukprot:m51a1_g7782 hypothetical protein (1253) ;mRNA; f:227088-233128